MKHIALAVSGLFLLGSVAWAQMGGGPPPEPCAALAKFFSRDAAFTASAKVVMTGKKARENQTMVMLFAVSGRRMRNEMDMTKMSGVRASDMEGMKQMGMDKIVVLVLPEQKAAYMVFPSLKSYCDMPPGKKNNGTEGKVEKTELGSETIEKHPCAKSKLTFTDKNGKTAEAVVWEATDLKDFPIQYQTVEDGQTTTVTFGDIKMGKPEESLFELPTDFKRYGSMQEMMMGNMQRMMPQQ
jgi:outer membrane lipoprotein-sorting protein